MKYFYFLSGLIQLFIIKIINNVNETNITEVMRKYFAFIYLREEINKLKLFLFKEIINISFSEIG